MTQNITLSNLLLISQLAKPVNQVPYNLTNQLILRNYQQQLYKQQVFNNTLLASLAQNRLTYTPPMQTNTDILSYALSRTIVTEEKLASASTN
jgi:hypothetical protein